MTAGRVLLGPALVLAHAGRRRLLPHQLCLEEELPQGALVATTKTRRRVLSGTSDASIRFDDLCSLLESLGFEKRVKGGHEIFRRAGVEEKINL